MTGITPSSTMIRKLVTRLSRLGHKSFIGQHLSYTTSATAQRNNLQPSCMARQIRWRILVHWIPNLFMVPSGSSGKEFIGELVKLFDAFASKSSYESFAIKVVMTMPALQKPYSKSKSHEHISCLNRRLEVWEIGNISELSKEGKLIQIHLRSSLGSHPNDDSEKLARTFSKLMIEGRMRVALHLLLMNTRTNLLSLLMKL